MSQTNLTPLNKFKVGDAVIYNREGYNDYCGRIGIVVEVDNTAMPYRVQYENGQSLWCFRGNVKYAKNQIVINILNDL